MSEPPWSRTPVWSRPEGSIGVSACATLRTATPNGIKLPRAAPRVGAHASCSHLSENRRRRLDACSTLGRQLRGSQGVARPIHTPRLPSSRLVFWPSEEIGGSS
jgi:hypothetical protein